MEKTAAPVAEKKPVPFKSEHAAKCAYRAAEKKFEAARDAYNAVMAEGRENGFCDAVFAKLAAADEAKKAAFDAAHEVYKKVIAEGYFVKSWHFGHNPTRDLIAANMD